MESSAEPAGGIDPAELVLRSGHARLDRVLVLVLGLARPDKVTLLSLALVRRILEVSRLFSP